MELFSELFGLLFIVIGGRVYIKNKENILYNNINWLVSIYLTPLELSPFFLSLQIQRIMILGEL